VAVQPLISEVDTTDIRRDKKVVGVSLCVFRC
jgi:hypothetical protein